MGKDEKKEPLIWRFLPPDIKSALKDLSRRGYVYIGRNGYGFTYDFRNACAKKGSVKVLEAQRPYLTPLGYDLLQHCLYEGSRFASYDSLIQMLPAIETRSRSSSKPPFIEE